MPYQLRARPKSVDEPTRRDLGDERDEESVESADGLLSDGGYSSEEASVGQKHRLGVSDEAGDCPSDDEASVDSSGPPKFDLSEVREQLERDTESSDDDASDCSDSVPSLKPRDTPASTSGPRRVRTADRGRKSRAGVPAPPGPQRGEGGATPSEEGKHHGVAAPLQVCIHAEGGGDIELELAEKGGGEAVGGDGRGKECPDDGAAAAEGEGGAIAEGEGGGKGVSDDGNTPAPSVPSGRSICHDLFRKKKAVLLSLDIETGGEYCGTGIVQISAEICRLNLVPNGKGITGDTASKISRSPRTFNRYVNPGEDVLWDEKSTAIHGLHRNHPSIRAANYIDVVWREFERWVDKEVQRDEVAVLVAYNGSTCDLKWLWRLTQAPLSHFDMPPKIKYFLDPYNVACNRN